MILLDSHLEILAAISCATVLLSSLSRSAPSMLARIITAPSSFHVIFQALHELRYIRPTLNDTSSPCILNWWDSDHSDLAVPFASIQKTRRSSSPSTPVAVEKPQDSIWTTTKDKIAKMVCKLDLFLDPAHQVSILFWDNWSLASSGRALIGRRWKLKYITQQSAQSFHLLFLHLQC
jgi:hypothetical protein